MNIEYRTVKIVDSRICHRCGSRYGFCPHTEGQRQDSTLDVPRKGASDHRSAPHWDKSEIATLTYYFNRGNSPDQIAELMSRTKGSISGQIMRLGLKRDRAA